MTERNNVDIPMTDLLDNDGDMYRDMRLPRLDLLGDDTIYDMYRSLTSLVIRPQRQPGSVLFEYDGHDPVILEILYGNSRSSSRSSRR